MITGESHEDSPLVERTARMLAGAAGHVWERLQNHPGYYRTYWRQEAMHALGLRDPVRTRPLADAGFDFTG